MVDKINVEIPLDLAKKATVPHYYGNPDVSGVMELVKAALPREYPDGTYAWVTAKGSASRRLVFRENGCWVTREDGPTYVYDYEVAKVEVLPVAGAGEMVVPRPPASLGGIWNAAQILEKNYYHSIAEWLRKVSKDA